MSTAKEIEEIIGIPARTIDTWSRGRDDKYLLAKLLKSYSTFELLERINYILEVDKFIKKSLGDFVIDLANKLSTLGIIDSHEDYYVRDAVNFDDSENDTLTNYKPFQLGSLNYWNKHSPDLTVEMANDLVMQKNKAYRRIILVDFISLLPSKQNLIAMYDRYTNMMTEIYSKHEIGGKNNNYLVELILITKSKKPKFLLKDDKLAKKIKIFDFDEVATKLYGKEIIVI